MVSVFGRDYPIRPTADLQAITAAAAALHERMEAVASRMQKPTRDSVAVLAGMSLADDLRRARADLAGDREGAAARVSSMCDRLERVLHKGTPAS